MITGADPPFADLKAEAFRLGVIFFPDLTLLQFEAIVGDGFLKGFADQNIDPKDMRFQLAIIACFEHPPPCGCQQCQDSHAAMQN